MKLFKLSKLYKKKKNDDKDTSNVDSNTSNLNTTPTKDNNKVDSNDLRKTKATENNKHFLNNDENNVNARSFTNTNEKNKYRSASMKSYNTHQHSTGVLDSDISDSDDAKQVANKDIRPIMNNKRPPQQHRQRQVENPSFRMNPDTSSSKSNINDPVIAKMQDRHRNQVRMAALRKQQMLLEEEEQKQPLRPLYSPSPSSPIPTSPSVASSLVSAGNYYSPHPHHYQQQPIPPPMMPYMMLSPYPTPMMDPYMYHTQARPLQTDTSSHASFVSLPPSFQPSQHGLYNDQQQQQKDNRADFSYKVAARSKSASIPPTMTKTKTHEKASSSSQSSSDTELSTPSKDSFSKGFPALDEEEPTDADIESSNEDEPTPVGKLRQRDNHRGYTRRRGTKNEDKILEEYFNRNYHCDQKMQAYQQQWQQQPFPIYSSPYYYYPSSSYAGMDPYNAQQDRHTSLMSNGPISQG
ncbi:hypothetical protein K501DRAFT_336791 [Backusella circina FSU 941]|nr:hypothetical protein K501DRAFT_336791 [Backusella circina FSU 941]